MQQIIWNIPTRRTPAKRHTNVLNAKIISYAANLKKHLKKHIGKVRSNQSNQMKSAMISTLEKICGAIDFICVLFVVSRF